MATTSHLWARRHYRESQYRFANAFLEYAREHAEDYDALQKEIANLLIAIRWCIEQQESQLASEFVNTLSGFLIDRGYWEEAVVLGDHAANLVLQLLAHLPNDEKLQLDFVTLRILSVVALLLMGDRVSAERKFEELTTNGNLGSEIIKIGLDMLAGFFSYTHGQVDETISSYEISLEKMHSLGLQHLQTMPFMLDMMAQMLAEQGDFTGSLKLYEEKLQILRQTHDIESMIETLYGLSSIAKMAGLPDLAASCLYDAAELAQEYPTSVQQEVLEKLAEQSLTQGDYVKAAELYERAIALARSSSDRPNMADMLRMLAFAKEELGEDIGKILEESLSISRKIKDFPGMARSLIQLGGYYVEKGEMLQAKRCYTQAVDIASAINADELEALSWEGLGDVAFLDQNWPEAQQAYEKSLHLYQSAHTVENIVRVLYQLGQTLFHQNKLPEAKKAFQAGLELNEQFNDPEAQAEGLYSLACIAVREKRMKDALQLSRLALDILKRIDSEYADELEREVNLLSEILESER